MDPNKSAEYPAPFGATFYKSGQRVGRGQYLVVTVTSGMAGVAQIVEHGLQRIPQMLLLLDAGNAPYPGFTWPIAGRTTTQISLTLPAAGSYLFWIN